MEGYIPDQGDLVTLSFNPQAGREQKGRRPALIVSKKAFNRATGLAVCCPVTNTERRIPFHVALSRETGLTGFVMCEQIKSVDFRSRKARFVSKAPTDLANEVLAILDAVLYSK